MTFPARRSSAVCNLRVAGDGVFADEGDGVVGREVVAVVGEDGEAEGADGAVGGVAGDDVDLVVGEGAVEQAEIHGAQGGEVQVVGGGEAGEAVGAGLELVADAEAQLRGELGRVGDGVEVEARASSPRTTMAKVSLKPRGGPTRTW